MFQFIHAADIHLDSPLRGLAQFEGAPVERIQSATREAFKNLVQLALDEHVAFVLIAGDLWDCDWPDAGPGLFFIHEVARLDRAGIPVFIVKGNHDAHSQITSAIREWPPNVKIFTHKKPQTLLLEKWSVAIHGQSYAQQHVLEDLAESYPAPVPGAFNIGMLHTCLEDGGTDYAPACVDQLVARGYDYWALGHAHNRQDFSRDGVHIEFPGNLQGRSIRETGPKGCTLVTVADDHSVTTRFEVLDVVRWEEISVQADDCNIEAKVRLALEAALLDCPDRLLAARLHITGSVARGQDLRDRLDAVAAGLDEAWIEKIVINSQPVAGGDLRDGTPISMLDAEIRQTIAELEADDGLVSQWMQDLIRLNAHLTGELQEIEAAKALTDRGAFRELAAQIGEAL